MTKNRRLVDFQVGAEQPATLDANVNLFAFAEPVRLWLKERPFEAPFRKIAIALVEPSVAGANGHVMNAGGVCSVSESIARQTLMSSASDPQWVLQRVEFALQRIEEVVGWRCSALAEFAHARAFAPSPFVILLDRFAQTDKRTGMRCVPWVSTEPGVTLIGVRIGQRDEVLRRGQTLCLEYELPIVRTAIVDGHFVLLGKNREQLARVPIVMK